MRQEKVVLVTGASSGIGKAIATVLSEQGYCVYGTSRRPQGDYPYAMLPMDVTSDESVHQAIDRLYQQTRRIDVVINNAGVESMGAFEEHTPAEIQQLFETNFFGVLRVNRAVLPYMRQRRSGQLIHISSVFGFMGFACQGIYAASKHAIEGYSESLRMELNPFNISVTVLQVGAFSTEIASRKTQASLKVADYAGLHQQVDKFFDQAIHQGGNPIRVGQKIQQIIETPKPRGRYQVGLDAYAMKLVRYLVSPDTFQSLMKFYYFREKKL